MASKSFDLLTRELSIGGTKVTLLFIDGLTNDQVVTLVLQNLTRLERAEILPDALKKLFNTHLGYTELEEVQYLEDIVDKILAGPMAILVDGPISVDSGCQNLPRPQPEEPIREGGAGSRTDLWKHLFLTRL